MSKVFDKITIHCSATQNLPSYNASVFREWHMNKGWSDIGYHFVIKTDGTLETGRSLKRMGAQVRGHNKNNIGICLVGGVDANGKPEANYTDEQMECLGMFVTLMSDIYSIDEENVRGHRDFPGVNKACPCFDVKEWLATGVVA